MAKCLEWVENACVTASRRWPSKADEGSIPTEKRRAFLELRDVSDGMGRGLRVGHAQMNIWTVFMSHQALGWHICSPALEDDKEKTA